MIESREKLYLAGDLFVELFIVGVDSNALDCIELRVELIANLEHLAESASAELAKYFELDIKPRLHRIVRELSQVDIVLKRWLW